jgi:pimeloyl-ACP methyl ester carboxylesterase
MATDILARNNVTVSGRGTQPMVFVHGFGCDQQMWRFITPAFENDYRIVQFDYVGHGGSDRGALMLITASLSRANAQRDVHSVERGGCEPYSDHEGAPQTRRD